MQQRTLGGRRVGVIGLGAMPMSVDERPVLEQSMRTIHAALDAGITLIDTADAYCRDTGDIGHNERVVAEGLRTWPGDRDAITVATKGGHTRGGDGSWGLDGTPEHLRSACDASLAALGVEVIDLYQLHRPDPEVPVVESVGALAELQEAGKVRLIGVSNFSVDMLEQVRAVADIAAVQNEYSPAFRSSADEVRCCEEQGIAFLAWSPLGGMGAAGQLGSRFPAFGAVADELGASPQQIALAWELAQSPAVIPIPGASRPETILASVAAGDIELSPDQLQRLADH